MSLSDASHYDTCAGRHCRGMFSRADMQRLPGRRGYFCADCVKLYGKIPGQTYSSNT
jgi:hypothetical protein